MGLNKRLKGIYKLYITLSLLCNPISPLYKVLMGLHKGLLGLYQV